MFSTRKPQECRRFSGGNRDRPGLRGTLNRSGNGCNGENAALGNYAHHGLRTGSRSVFAPEPWRQGLLACTAGAVSMAILACAVALTRDTTGHDWYSAYKITVADLMIGAGFDEDAPIEFRRADGAVETVSRWHLSHDFDARWARDRMLEAAWQGATLGGLSGFGGALLCLVLVWRIMNEPRTGRREHEPAASRRPEAPDRLAPSTESSMSAPARTMPESLTPSHAPAAQAHRSTAKRPPVPDAPRSTKSEHEATRQTEAATGKENTTAPARRERRNRDHGRWV